MRRATVDQAWEGMDAVEDRERHPLHSRLRQPPPLRPTVIAARAVPPPLPMPALAPKATRTATIAPLAEPVAVKPVPKRSMLRRVGSALAFSLLGFVTGAVFWHFVGFWDFVGQVMFGARTSGTQISQPPPIKLKERVTGVSSLTVTIEPEACTTLQLDRETGATQSIACEPQSLPLRSLRIAKREDLWVTGAQRIQEATSRGWSLVKVETPAKAQEQAAAD